MNREQGSPIAGYIIDASGGYDRGILPYRPAMYYAGSFALAAAALAAAARYRISKGINRSNALKTCIMGKHGSTMTTQEL